MMKRYIVFDVETPNSSNDRMSAIGITVVENGEIVDEFNSLINPETYFDYFNISLTGITPEAVCDKPTFPEIWQEIKPYFESGILIAHNAPFDMSVLAKCLINYEIDWKPTTEYACTCRIGRKCLPDLPDHRLDTMCDYIGIDLNHHRAESDSRACAEILIFYIDNGIDISGFVRHYDLINSRTLKSAR